MRGRAIGRAVLVGAVLWSQAAPATLMPIPADGSPAGPAPAFAPAFAPPLAAPNMRAASLEIETTPSGEWSVTLRVQDVRTALASATFTADGALAASSPAPADAGAPRHAGGAIVALGAPVNDAMLLHGPERPTVGLVGAALLMISLMGLHRI